MVMPTLRQFFLLVYITAVRCSVEEQQLLRSLLSGYDTDVRPVPHSSHILHTSMDLSLLQLVGVDEVNQILNTKVTIYLSWYDSHLTWNESIYAGIHTIQLCAGRVWRPDVVLYNDVYERRYEAEKYQLSVTSQGLVTWPVSAVLHSSCSLDMTYFPWDQQRCPLIFGSWIMDQQKMELSNKSATGDTSGYMLSGEWDLLEFSVQKQKLYVTENTEPYHQLAYEVVIQRKPLFYVTNLILPCAFISGTILLVFLLPPESGEKISLALTILLAVTVFLTMAAESMPAQSLVIPLIARYFLGVMVLLSASCMLTVMVIGLHHNGERHREVPVWVRTLVLKWLAWGVGLRGLVILNKHKHRTYSSCTETPTDTDMSHNSPGVITNPVFLEEPHKGLSSIPECDQSSDTSSQLVQILAYLELFRKWLYDHRQRGKRICEWMLVAQVLDRLMLVIFFILMAAIHLTILMSY